MSIKPTLRSSRSHLQWIGSTDLCADCVTDHALTREHYFRHQRSTIEQAVDSSLESYILFQQLLQRCEIDTQRFKPSLRHISFTESTPDFRNPFSGSGFEKNIDDVFMNGFPKPGPFLHLIILFGVKPISPRRRWITVSSYIFSIFQAFSFPD